MNFNRVALICCLAIAMPAAAGQDEIEFNRDIVGLLSNRCFKCHGPDENTREAGLRLDVRESAVAELDSGNFAIVPEDPEASELLYRIETSDDSLRMPPIDSGDALTISEQNLIRNWIEQGAEYQSHWAFESPSRPAVPSVDNQAWPINEIDHFVLSRLEEADLTPNEPANRASLVRRVAFDLTGLPPTLDEIELYGSDTAEGAYERMVDRYLASPAYGEHMAKHWLDLARYADTNGYQYDTERQQWVWRDWVIDAYNRNLPFDRFSIEQLAGDLLPDATAQQRLATGFQRNHGITIEGGVIDEEYRTEYVMDRVVTTGTVWLGLTLGCARCHDHKYDPISQEEFYQLFAYFNQVPERGMNGFDPREQIPSPLDTDRQQAIEQQLAELERSLAQPIDVDDLETWASNLNADSTRWQILAPTDAVSSGGSRLQVLDDRSILAGDANPSKDVYEITTVTEASNLTAIRLEALTHESLPSGGPGRHSNSNFVLSEFELDVVSIENPDQRQTVKFSRAIADYSQANYEIAKAIDGTTNGNNGWAVDGPTRKEPATAMFIAEQPFGFEGGSELHIRLRHEANFATHGIGRPRLSVSTTSPEILQLESPPAPVLEAAALPRQQRDQTQQDLLVDYYQQTSPFFETTRQQITELIRQRDEGYPATMIMADRQDLRPTHVLQRGQYDLPMDQVGIGVPEALPGLQEDSAENRLGLAQWLFQDNHPLTSRVAVNRYWQQLFGIGLVATPEDFGIQGELPSHPELLDWLAIEFIEHEWNTKRLLKQILLSATYRQSSFASESEYLSDPSNRLLARGPRPRLSAEEIRDQALMLSGLLVEQLGGKSVYPYQPDGLWLELNNRPGYSRAYQRGTGDDLYRRSLYTFWKRTVPSPMLKTFDAPEREFCTVQRSRTNTPLQALLLLNGIQFVEASRHFGAKIMNEGGLSDTDRIQFAFRSVTSRLPNDQEIEFLTASVERNRSYFSTHPDRADRLLEVGDSPRIPDLDPIEHATWTTLCRILLNLDEAITKG